MDVWEYLESPADYATDVADLYYWSTNFDAGKGPFTLFLDLIGWTFEEGFGEALYSLNDASLGYVELSKLAAALKQYSDRPQDVYAWVVELMLIESGIEDEDSAAVES